MTFYIDEYIDAFLISFEECHSKLDYIRLLEKSELMCVEYLNSLTGDEYNSFYEQSPLLAMVSEVLYVCPEAVIDLAEEKLIFSTAAFMLSSYSEQDRLFLRTQFLKRDDKNVIYIDFEKKEKG
jgi:hypothetical protein